MNIDFIRNILLARKKTVLALVALIALNLLLYFYGTVFQRPHLDTMQRQLDERRQAAAGGVTKDAATVYREGKKDLETWRNRIAPKKDFARFVGSLFELAAGNSLKVRGVQYQPAPIMGEDLIAFTIHFDVSGKYSGIKSFIADLGRSPDIMHIDNISLSNAKQTEEAISMKVLLTAYFRPEGK